MTLAVKTVLAEVDRVPTLVFDEIDTGVGGRLGAVLARRWRAGPAPPGHLRDPPAPDGQLRHHQWVIRKQVENGRTRTTITPLDESDRVEELAAMLRGDSAAEGTRQEALAMLVEAQADQ